MKSNVGAIVSEF